MRTSFYVLSGGFFCGVLWRSFFVPELVSVLALMFGVSFLLLVAQQMRHTRIVALYVSLGLLALVLGVVRTEFADRQFQEGLIFYDGEEIDRDAHVIGEPDVRDESVILTLALEGDASNVRVRARVPLYPRFAYGDHVHLTGKVERPLVFETETGRTFDYPGFLQKDHIQYETRNARVMLVGHDEKHGLKRALFGIKGHWLASVSRIVPEPGASLLGGVVVGAKQSLGGVWLDAFRDVGLIHIVVLSGYNLTIVAVFILWLAHRLPRTTRFILGASGIVAFALMTGAGATVVRASIMALLALLAQVVTRPYAVVRALIMAALMMVLWNPFVLAFDPGFQLSCIATLGLILGSPLVEAWFTKIPTALGLRAIVSATIATQIAVLPLLMYQVGAVSLVALIVNILVLPIVPLLMAVGFVAGVAGMMSTTVALPFVAGAHILLVYIFKVVALFGALSWRSLSLPPIPLWFLLCMYGSLLWLWLRMSRAQK